MVRCGDLGTLPGKHGAAPNHNQPAPAQSPADKQAKRRKENPHREKRRHTLSAEVHSGHRCLQACQGRRRRNATSGVQPTDRQANPERDRREQGRNGMANDAAKKGEEGKEQEARTPRTDGRTDGRTHSHPVQGHEEAKASQYDQVDWPCSQAARQPGSRHSMHTSTRIDTPSIKSNNERTNEPNPTQPNNRNTAMLQRPSQQRSDPCDDDGNNKQPCRQTVREGARAVEPVDGRTDGRSRG